MKKRSLLFYVFLVMILVQGCAVYPPGYGYPAYGYGPRNYGYHGWHGVGRGWGGHQRWGGGSGWGGHHHH